MTEKGVDERIEAVFDSFVNGRVQEAFLSEHVGVKIQSLEETLEDIKSQLAKVRSDSEKT